MLWKHFISPCGEVEICYLRENLYNFNEWYLKDSLYSAFIFQTADQPAHAFSLIGCGYLFRRSWMGQVDVRLDLKTGVPSLFCEKLILWQDSLVALSKYWHMLPSFTSLKVPLNSRCSVKARKAHSFNNSWTFKSTTKVHLNVEWSTQVFVFKTRQWCIWYILNVNQAFGAKEMKGHPGPFMV